MRKKLQLLKSLCVAFLLLISISWNMQGQSSLNFDGTDDYVQTDYQGVQGSNARTIEAWVKTEATTGDQLIATWGSDATNGRRFTVRLNGTGNKVLRVEIKGGGFDGTTTVNDGNWHHIAVTYDPGLATNKYKLYVDGILDTEQDISQAINTQTGTNLLIGRRITASYGGFFDGDMDEFRMWDVARTQAEIQASMNAEVCDVTANLIAYFKMNDGVSGEDNTGVTSLADSSGNGYEGTFNGFALTGTTSNFGNSSGITGCSVEPCEIPTNISITDIDVDNANVNWTENGSAEAWTIRYGESGFDVETEGADLATDSNGGTAITGLELDTTYDVYVRADCEGSASDWSLVKTFTTLAEESCPGPIDFSSSNITSNSVDLMWTESGEASVWAVRYGAPGFTPSDGGTDAYDEDGIAGISIEGLDADTSYDFYVSAFCGPGDLSDWVGPLSVTTLEAPVCEVPTNINITDIDVDSANVNWTENGSAEAWTIRYGESGFDVGTEGTDLATDSNGGTAITGLELDTTYDVYVRADCEGSASDWSLVKTFTTLAEESCPAPSGFTASNETSSTVDLSWTAEAGNELFWIVQYGEPGFDPDTEGTQASQGAAEGTTMTLEGLTANTTYEVYIKALCPAGDLGDWGEPITVTTLEETTAGNTVALNFGGTDDYIQTDYPGVLGNAARTVEAWVKTEEATGEHLLVSWGSDATNGRRFTVRLNGSTTKTLRVEIKGGGFNGTTMINDGNWHHVAVTYDPDLTTNKYKLYVDGVLDTENDIAQTINTEAATNLLIGRRVNAGFGGYPTGSIDEVRIWSIARTQTEIQTDMNTELCSGTSNLEAYFKMNDGLVEGDNTSLVSISDSSGNGYVGTLNGFALTGSTSNFVEGSGIAELDGTIDNTVSVTETDLTANQAGATYQWVDCNNDNTAIEGETNQTFTPMTSGNYAVEITTGSCSVVSECINFEIETGCTAPSDLAVSAIMATTVQLSWTENGDAPAWDIKYGAPDFDPDTEGTSFVDNDGETGEELGILDPGTAYEVYIRAFCDIDEYSDWFGPIEFTTLEETCEDPSTIEISAISESTADVSWIENGEASEWEILYGETGFNPENEGTTLVDNDETLGESLETLTAETTYDVYVRAVCGEDEYSEWTGPVSFTTTATPCEAIGDFSESFDEVQETPECWNLLKVNSTGTSGSISVTGAGLSIEDPYSAPYHIRVFNQLDAAAEFYMVTPELNNLSSGDHQLRFLLFGNQSVIVEVGTMLDPEDGTTFSSVETFEDTPAEYQEYIVFFDEAYANQHVAIKVSYTATFKNIYIDNVNWEPIPSCPKPTALAVENLTSTSADLSWTENGDASQWEILYGEAGFNPETEGTTIQDTDELGETVEGLEIGTDYEFYVKSICSDEDESEWSFVGTFTTLCDVYPLDYTEDFTSFLPNCWEVADSGNPTTGPSAIGSSNWVAIANHLNNPENSPATKIILFGNTISDWLISPEIDLATTSELSYSIGITDLNSTTSPAAIGEDDEIQVLITTDGGTTWETLKTYTNEDYPSAEGVNEVIDLSAYQGTAQIAFWASSGTVSDGQSYDLFIDNVEVYAIELPCEIPTDVQATVTEENSVEVTWTENGQATQWEVIYGAPGFDPETEGTTIQDNDGTLGVSIEGLEAGEDYDLYVRAVCGEDNYSDWSEVETFTYLAVEAENFKEFTYYPNPVKDRLNLRSGLTIDQITIYNLLGQVIVKQHPNNLSTAVDVTHLQTGAYLMKVQVKGAVKTFRIIKE